MAPFGSHHFEIPFNATGKKWVRFAAWDSAGNGAFVQPVSVKRPLGQRAEGKGQRARAEGERKGTR
jgi:hypothetical protein